MQSIRTLVYQENPDASNRFAKLAIDFDLEETWEITLNGTDSNGDYVYPHFIAIDNYTNDVDIAVKIDSLESVVASFVKVIWQISPLVETLKITGTSGEITIWISEKKLPIGEGINEHGVVSVGSNVTRVNSKPALQAITNPAQGFAAYITAKYIKGLFTFDAANHATDVANDPKQGIFIAPLADPTGASGVWIRDYGHDIDICWTGAVPDYLLNNNFDTINPNATDSGPAIQAAFDLSHYLYTASSLGGGFYKGGPRVIYFGAFLNNATTLNAKHNFKFKGFGDGQHSPNKGPVSYIKFGPNTPGIIAQFPNTSGVLAVDGVTHDGSGGFEIEDMMLEGAWLLGTYGDGDYDALVIRGITRARNLYLKNWQGRGVRAWAGNTSGGPNVSGNASVSRLDSVKAEGCLIGLDKDGSDSNIIIDINCQWYQNRKLGVRSFNGAGSGASHAPHAASNGMISNIGVYTQASLAGERYALQPLGDPLISPSGTTADTPNWAHVEAGGVIANLIPAWVATPGLFRHGGDYYSGGSDSTTYNSAYSENGTMNWFNAGSVIINPTIANQYFRGGVAILPAAGGLTGLSVRQSGVAQVNIMGSGGECLVMGFDLATGLPTGYIDMVKNGPMLLLGYSSVNVRIGTYGVNTAPMSFDDTGINLAAGRTYQINGVQVLNGQMAHIANLGAPPTAADFNGLIGSLQTVKLMA